MSKLTNETQNLNFNTQETEEGYEYLSLNEPNKNSNIVEQEAINSKNNMHHLFSPNQNKKAKSRALLSDSPSQTTSGNNLTGQVPVSFSGQAKIEMEGSFNCCQHVKCVIS